MDEDMEPYFMYLKVLFAACIVLYIIELLREETRQGNFLFAFVILLIILGLGYIYLEFLEKLSIPEDVRKIEKIL